VSEESHGRRIKVPVGSMPGAHAWLSDPALGLECKIAIANESAAGVASVPGMAKRKSWFAGLNVVTIGQLVQLFFFAFAILALSALFEGRPQGLAVGLLGSFLCGLLLNHWQRWPFRKKRVPPRLEGAVRSTEYVSVESLAANLGIPPESIHMLLGSKGTQLTRAEAERVVEFDRNLRAEADAARARIQARCEARGSTPEDELKERFDQLSSAYPGKTLREAIEAMGRGEALKRLSSEAIRSVVETLPPPEPKAGTPVAPFELAMQVARVYAGEFGRLGVFSSEELIQSGLELGWLAFEEYRGVVPNETAESVLEHIRSECRARVEKLLAESAEPGEANEESGHSVLHREQAALDQRTGELASRHPLRDSEAYTDEERAALVESYRLAAEGLSDTEKHVASDLTKWLSESFAARNRLLRAAAPGSAEGNSVPSGGKRIELRTDQELLQLCEGLARGISSSFSASEFAELFEDKPLSSGWQLGNALAVWYSLGHFALAVAAWTSYNEPDKVSRILDLCRPALSKQWNLSEGMIELVRKSVNETEAEAFKSFVGCESEIELGRFFARWVSRILGAPIPFSRRTVFDDQLMGLKYVGVDPILHALLCHQFISVCGATKRLLYEITI
jgi:hypothetical protein